MNHILITSLVGDAAPLPSEWLSGLSAHNEIQQLTETITHHV